MGDLTNFEKILTTGSKTTECMSIKCRNLIFSEKQKPLQDAPLSRKGFANSKISQFEHIQVTLDILLITSSQIEQLTPGEPMVTLFERP